MHRNRIRRDTRVGGAWNGAAAIPEDNGFVLVQASGAILVPLTPLAAWQQEVYRLAFARAEAAVRATRRRRRLLFGTSTATWN